MNYIKMSSREKWVAFQAGLHHDVVIMRALWVQESWSMAVIIQSWCHHFPQTSSSSFVPYLRGTNIDVIVYPRILLPLPPPTPTTSPTINKSCQLYFIILFQNPSCFSHTHTQCPYIRKSLFLSHTHKCTQTLPNPISLTYT